ncbi:MAG: hypothetical protein DYH02_12860 [Candidatus Omnitrophica bacterium COP1]|nr:hypothetical protein [Candidatus Omnitrophica bacterium COP1]
MDSKNTHDNSAGPSDGIDGKHRILMFFPGKIESLPPLLTSSVAMKIHGAEVRVVAFSSSDSTLQYLKNQNIEVILVRNEHPCSLVQKAFMWLESFWVLYKQKRSFKPTCLWFHLGHVFIIQAFIPFLKTGVSIAVQVHELVSYSRFLFMLANRLIRKAEIVILSEKNRAFIIKEFSRSRARFIIIPNRPLEDAIPAEGSKSATRQIFQSHGGSDQCREFLIYQGIFTDDRCLVEIVSAFHSFQRDDVGLILMGGTLESGFVNNLRKICHSDKRVVIIGHIPPPDHLSITKGCYAGIALYAPTRLNQIYCAPNKIYEFAACGIGMILPDFPGMAEIAYKHHIAVLCNPLDPGSILQAMETILSCEIDKSKTSDFLKSDIDPKIAYHEVYKFLDSVVE